MAKTKLGALSGNLARGVVLLVVLAVVIGGGYYLLRGPSTKKVTAEFTKAVGVYTGTPVRVLGVNVGEVTAVTPKGNRVEVEMEYDEQYSIPAKANAVEVANSLVSDRYIQLSPYSGKGAILADGATIPLDRTAAPAELDDIYRALNTLSVALGPNGANKNGALSNLLKVSAANLKGNGAALGQSITKLSQAAQTLSDGREDLFGTVSNLRRFTKALSDSDGQVRKFNTQLAQVAKELAGERGDLAAALKQLGLALNDVQDFVKKNAGKFHEDVRGLRLVTSLLVKQKASLTETLAVAPVALANLVHAYQPNLGVLATRGNLASLADPGQLCALIDLASGKLANLLPAVGNFLGPLTKSIVSTCDGLVKQSPDLLKLLQDPDFKKVADDLAERLAGLPLGPITGGG